MKPEAANFVRSGFPLALACGADLNEAHYLGAS